MKQVDLLAAPTPARTDDTDGAERDLFGNPINVRGDAAPTYRPRAPVQQTLDLAPGTFALAATDDEIADGFARAFTTAIK